MKKLFFLFSVLPIFCIGCISCADSSANTVADTQIVTVPAPEVLDIQFGEVYINDDCSSASSDAIVQTSKGISQVIQVRSDLWGSLSYEECAVKVKEFKAFIENLKSLPASNFIAETLDKKVTVPKLKHQERN